MARLQNPLYLMHKPPPEVAARIAALPRNDPGRAPELLHVTLLKLFDLASAPPDWLPRVITALDALDGQAFALSFDRIEIGKVVKLVNRAELPQARAFQAGLVRHLLEHKAPLMPGTTPVPHITINYKDDRQGNRATDPIAWTATEVMLVESVVGQTRHVEQGRWQLR